MNQDIDYNDAIDSHYERFKQERAAHLDSAQLDQKYADWKKSRSSNGKDMTSSETTPDQAPRYESFLESFGRAIGEVTTVPAGPDSIDQTPNDPRDADKANAKA